jgi:hypothetical protein
MGEILGISKRGQPRNTPATLQQVLESSLVSCDCIDKETTYSTLYFIGENISSKHKNIFCNFKYFLVYNFICGILECIELWMR